MWEETEFDGGASWGLCGEGDGAHQEMNFFFPSGSFFFLLAVEIMSTRELRCLQVVDIYGGANGNSPFFLLF